MGRILKRTRMTRRRWRGRGGMRRICRTALYWSILSLLQLLFQGSFKQDKVQQPHHKDTQRPNIMNYLVTPKAPDHLPLAPLSCLPEQYNHCGKIFSRKSSLSNHMLVVHGASCPSKILQDKNLTKLMAGRRIRFVIFYIAFKTRIIFKKT